MKLRQEYCTFMGPEVLYLGHKITKEEIELTEDKLLVLHNTSMTK